MQIYPAIDIIDGKAVRLTKGDYSTAEVLSDNPFEVAESFLKKGANRLHVVDLDGAKSGTSANYAVISEITSKLNMFVEVGGGIRDGEKIEKYLAAGASRVILGTIAVENFSFVKEAVKKYGSAVAVGVDCKGGFVAVKGWREITSVRGFDFVKACRDAGVSAVIYTDIDTDGTMKGTNISAFEKLSEIKGVDIIASGGVSDENEIRELKKLGVAGVILGKAIYHNLIDLSSAVKIAAGEI